MDANTLQIIHWTVGIVLSLAAWIALQMWQQIKDLNSSHKALAEDLNKIKLVVAGDYVKRDEFNNEIREVMSILKAMFSKIDKITDKLAQKADRD